MSLNAFMQAVPPGVRLLLALAITLGITFLASRLMRGRRERVLEVPEGKTPAEDMLNVALAAVLTAFVFLAAILLANFWSSMGLAKTAVSDEQAAYAQITATLAMIGESDSEMARALTAYGDAAHNVQGPALRDADGDAASASHAAAARDVIASLASVKGKGSTVDEATLTTGVKDMLTNGELRQAALPTYHVGPILMILAIIGIFGLALAVILVPDSKPAALIVLVTLVFAVVLMYYLVVEMSNPYLNGDVVPLPGFGSRLS